MVLLLNCIDNDDDGLIITLVKTVSKINQDQPLQSNTYARTDKKYSKYWLKC